MLGNISQVECFCMVFMSMTKTKSKLDKGDRKSLENKSQKERVNYLIVINECGLVDY